MADIWLWLKLTHSAEAGTNEVIQLDVTAVCLSLSVSLSVSPLARSLALCVFLTLWLSVCLCVCVSLSLSLSLSLSGEGVRLIQINCTAVGTQQLCRSLRVCRVSYCPPFLTMNTTRTLIFTIV